MRLSTERGDAVAMNPIDVVESVVQAKHWIFDRRADDEMDAQAPGCWCDFSLHFAWNDSIAALHFSCAFDMRVPPAKRSPVHELLALINEKTWFGHFGLWEADGLPLFRYALPLRGVAVPSLGQMEDLLDCAVAECDRFYPAFQYVIWGGKSAADAAQAALLEPVGEA